MVDKAKLEQELQRKYLQLQMFKHQLNTLVEEKNNIDARLSEIRMTMDALEKIDTVKSGTEIWSPMGSNAFIMSDLKNTKDILVNIGAGVVVKTTKDHSLEILKSRLGEMEAVNTNMQAEIMKYSEEIGKLEPEVQKMAQGL